MEPRALDDYLDFDHILDSYDYPSNLLSPRFARKATIETPLAAAVTKPPKTKKDSKVAASLEESVTARGIRSHFPFLNRSDQFPYVGMLNCPWQGQDLTLFTSTGVTNAVNFFIHTLRAQCHPTIYSSTLRLFQREIVTVDVDSITHFRLNLKSKLMWDMCIS